MKTFLLSGQLVAGLWKRTGTVRLQQIVGGGVGGGASSGKLGERVKGKMTPTFSNMDTDGGKRSPASKNHSYW